MYKDCETDPVVKYYDETLALGGSSEIEWYSTKVSEFGGPILDLACGTGRLSLIFAKKGYHVTSLDASKGMLSIFREKLRNRSYLQPRIEIRKSTMSNFLLDQKFNSILCVDAFFHNLSIEEDLKCLECIAKHQTPSGRFFFNVHNYNEKFIEKCKDSRGKECTLRKKYWIRDNTEQIVLEQALDIDEIQQHIITLLRFNRYNKKAKLLSTEESKWITHIRTKEQYKNNIAQAGLMVEKVVGSYENGPVDENSQLIFQIKRVQ